MLGGVLATELNQRHEYSLSCVDNDDCNLGELPLHLATLDVIPDCSQDAIL